MTWLATDTRTAHTACVGPKRVVWALQVIFFSISLCFCSNSDPQAAYTIRGTHMPSTTPVRHPQPAPGRKRVVWALQVIISFFLVLTQTHSLHIPSVAPTACARAQRLVWALQVIFLIISFFFVLSQTHSLRIPSAAHTHHLPHPCGIHSVRRAQTTRLGPTGDFF